MTDSETGPRGVAAAHGRRHAHRVPAALVLVVSLLAAKASLDLGLGEATAPGPGMWPFMVSVFTAAAAAVLIFVEDPTDHERWTRRSFRIAGGLAALGAFIVAFSLVGFLIPAAALMLFWLRVFAEEPWRLAAPIALGTAVGLHLIFVVALGVPFPPGILLSGGLA